MKFLVLNIGNIKNEKFTFIALAKIISVFSIKIKDFFKGYENC